MHIQSHFLVLFLGCVPSKAVPSLRMNHKFYRVKIIFFLTRFMGKKKKKITIFTEKNVNPDGEVIQLTPMLSFPYKLQPHQQVFTFIRLQVSLESP